MGTGNVGEYGGNRASWKRSSGSQLGGAGGKTACNSRNIRDFPCNGDLSRQDDRGRQDGTGKSIRKTFRVVKSDSWNPGWCADTDLGTNRQCESGTDRTGKELLKFHVLRYVVFYCGTGI